MQLTFWGAAQTVTGSMHQVELDGRTFLLDCGLFQGRRKEAFERNRNLPEAARKADAVVLSHAHIDHSGNLPSLVKSGFSGPIYATAATVDLCRAMLPDSAHLQEKDSQFLAKRWERRKKLLGEHAGDGGMEPLYSMEDVERTLPLMETLPYRSETALTDGATVELFDAGHLLGSAALVLRQRRNGKVLQLAFSGDIGRPGLPIIRDPEPLPPVDYLIMESTYGNRLHKHDEVVVNKLAEVIVRTCQRGGKVIVPAFAVGRTQQLVLMLHQLCERKVIPSIPIFVDSPLAVNATEVYRRHSECFDEETNRFLWDGEDPFGFSRLRYIREVAESKSLNDLRGPLIIISASGMCEAGRILHHLRNNIEDPRNTVLIVGFQAEHTLGRKIIEKHPEVPIFGEPVRLRAEVVVFNELSAHADQKELLRWMKPFVRTLKGVFLVHGEPGQCVPFQEMIREVYGLEAIIPSRGQSFRLE